MGLRVRWRAVAKGAAIALGGLLAVQLAPKLLKPPEPPPVPADVGLPHVAVKPAQPRPGLGRVVSGGGVPRRAEPSEGKAPKRRAHRPFARRRSQPKRDSPTRRQDPPARRPAPEPSPASPSVSVPAPVPEPTPAPAPAPAPPAPAVPDDGSIEFAPH